MGRHTDFRRERVREEKIDRHSRTGIQVGGQIDLGRERVREEKERRGELDRKADGKTDREIGRQTQRSIERGSLCVCV